MCITDYFKFLSWSCAIKTLNLKFLTESKVKKKFVWFNGIGYEEKSRRKIRTREWLLKRNESGAYNGILNELRLTDKDVSQESIFV